MPKPCPACKELLDGAAVLARATTCMSNSVMLAARFDGHEPDAGLVAQFRAKAEELAVLAAQIEAQVSG